MTDDRRNEKRRLGDRVLSRTVETLQILARISGGQVEDYTEYYADLVGAKDLIGRRQQDRRLGDLLCSTIETIATNMDTLLEQERALRRVRVTKMSGKSPSRVAVHSIVEGWEVERPRVGKKYKIYKDDGGLFRSALVTEVKPDCFRTKNSLYRMEIVHRDL